MKKNAKTRFALVKIALVEIIAIARQKKPAVAVSSIKSGPAKNGRCRAFFD